jgi:hypothetical protein
LKGRRATHAFRSGCDGEGVRAQWSATWSRRLAAIYQQCEHHQQKHCVERALSARASPSASGKHEYPKPPNAAPSTSAGAHWGRASAAFRAVVATIKVVMASLVQKAYEDFFALWERADPDVSILKEAKAEYAKLQ